MGTATTIRGSIDLDVSSTVSFEKMLTSWVFEQALVGVQLFYITILQDVSIYFGESHRTCAFAVLTNKILSGIKQAYAP